MIIYKDIFTSDELASDTYPMKEVNEGVVLEMTCKYIVRGGGDIVLAGSNASAEGEDADDTDDLAAERGLDLVLNHNLVDMTSVFGQAAEFKKYIKKYLGKLAKKLKEDGKSDEEVKAFQTKLQTWVVALLKKDRFKELQFYCGESEEACEEGQLAILEYRDIDGEEKPIMMFIKDAMIAEKV